MSTTTYPHLLENETEVLLQLTLASMATVRMLDAQHMPVQAVDRAEIVIDGVPAVVLAAHTETDKPTYWPDLVKVVKGQTCQN